MAYSGFLSDPDYSRKSQDETITGKWVFKNEINFEKVIKGTAVASYYADLAEFYECERNELLPQGTLVKFGGSNEITKTSKNDRRCFGVISSEPGFVLNEKESDKNDEKAEQCSAFCMTAAMMDDISCISPFSVTANGNILM